MKKILLLVISILFVTGCGEKSSEDIINDFEEKVTSSTSYKIKGTMEIMNGEDKYTYSLESNYLKDDYYKVILINETNNHEQIILKNTEGVYVITPSLNKSFKFDSIWPENSSQSYILSSLIKDVAGDDQAELLESEEGYILKSSVNYPNNSNFSYQKIYFDKNIIPTKVEVFDKNDNLSIKVEFTEVDFKAGLKEEEFLLDNYIDAEENCLSTCEEGNEETNCETKCTPSEETMSITENVMYPLYMPNETYLTNSEEVTTGESERVILTFAGDKNFILIEEVASYSDDFSIIPINGNPMMLDDIIGAISTNSLYFTKNNIDYYLVSNDLTNEEMVNIAKSVGGSTPVSMTK